MAGSMPPEREKPEMNSEFPHVTVRECRLYEQYGHLLNNTGGNHPLKLLEEFRVNEWLLTRNIVRYLLAFGINTQLGLLASLEKDLVLLRVMAHATPLQPGDMAEHRSRELDPREVVAVGRDWLTLDIGGETSRIPMDNYYCGTPNDGLL